MGIRDVTHVRRLAYERDVAGLIDVLCDHARSGPERRVAATALGSIGDRRALEPLVSSLDDPKTCATAVHALAALGDPIAAAPLAELFASTGDRGLRREAERALYRLNVKDPGGVRRVLEGYERAKARRGRKQGRDRRP